ncbi:hypothetical protein BHU72_12640 [Desulfuribacillus stibiiarsenatis]|uniref:Ribosomal processing cysteine protease Prp n=1 Tax=Desulfuribacillus stibiiarsenatis TaxID=1390249 RepID=A0A1E5L285_9FIRM|nr:ribosomal-processing cysteine protease Prp [Desulfuribacillus stibiiarsenatis]OEH84245.1 hypothetical protein BHU72_12640 [Desulfuribacillus stibiiarsenatis]
MVEIKIAKNSLDEIVSLQVNGHAGYADAGQDIVCSAVSILTFNTINSIEHFLKAKLHPEATSLGSLECDFPVLEEVGAQEKMQLLLQSMLFGLRAIEENYKDFIAIKINYV